LFAAAAAGAMPSPPLATWAIGSIGGLDQGQMVKDDRAFNVKVAIVGDAGMRLAEQPL
jgi:hypothetical protein